MSRLRVVLLGTEYVGKSSLIAALQGQEFHNRRQTTPAPWHATINTKAKTAVHYPVTHTIWEVSGQPSYQYLSHLYTKEAHVIALVFDLTKPDTLTALAGYINSLNTSRRANAKLVLVGMKSDLVDAQPRDRLLQQINNFKERHGIEDYLEISARTQTGLDQFQKILDDHTPLPYCSLLEHKDAFIQELSRYKLNRERRGASLFGFSKKEKMAAATKVMACFYGSDTVIFSKKEEAALKERESELIKSILRAIPSDKQNIQLMRSLTETRMSIHNSANSSYKNALIQFLSDYKKLRESNPKQHYFFSCGIAKGTKINAVDKLIAHLKNEDRQSFTDAEIRALNNGTLKETIETTLSWFSLAPSLEDLIRQNTTRTGISTPSQITLR